MHLPVFVKVDTNMFSPFLLLLILLILHFFFKLWHTTSRKLPLPPGPTPWPIIGNLHQVGQKPHVTGANLARIYGPLISFRFGALLLVVASSPEAAMEILKTHDRQLSSRIVPSAFHHDFFRYSLIWSTNCNDNWKTLRTLCRNELFSAKAIEAQADLREAKLSVMIGFLRSKEGMVVNIVEIVFTTIFNILSNIFFAKDFLDLNDEHGTAGGLKGTLFEILAMGTTPNISDLYPALGILDLQGLRKGSLKLMKKVFAFWEPIIKERRGKQNIGSDGKPVFLDRLLAHEFNDDQINLLALELFTAGTDTTTSTIEWAMAELIKNKSAMSKLREELQREIGSGSISESQLPKLPYLDACIKETLRLHPPAPFLLPHGALETCEVMNYTIPEGAQILVNIWAIGRDPKVWENPLAFMPERFLDSSVDYKGQDFGFIPFGAGRRMCPGLPLGMKQVESILASLVHRFDWALPNDEDPLELDMSDKFGITLQKEKPLQLIFTQK